MKDLTLYECPSSPTVPFPFSRALRSNFLVCGQPTEDSRGNSANAAKIRLRTDHPTPLNHSLFPHSSFMQRNRRHTVYDLTALNLHEDGSRLDLDGHLTSRRAFAQRSRAVRDARGNVISRSLPVVPRVRRIRAEEGEGEEAAAAVAARSRLISIIRIGSHLYYYSRIIISICVFVNGE